MMDDRADPADDAEGFPATMADLFLALVAVVVLMLLSLAPAIRTPGALAPSPPFDVSRADLRLDGRAPVVLVAEADGLRVPSQSDRVVPLDALLDDASLADRLRPAAAGEEEVLLVIRPRGQEAAFLFSSLAGLLGLPHVHQLRLDDDCGYVLDRPLSDICRARTPSRARP